MGLLLLMFVVSLCLFTSVTLLLSGRKTVSEEMDRLGFGSFTVWVNGSGEEAAAHIGALPDVGEVRVQPLLFTGYEIGGKHSDNEGQLLVYDGDLPYRFVTEDGDETAAPEIEPGTVYLSPAMRATYDVAVGDTIRFELLRANGIREFTVAGYFADAFMGSSMIDMKSFLICEADREMLLALLDSAPEYDVLAKPGAMLHVFQKAGSMLSEADFQKSVYESSDLSLYAAFSYSRSSIQSYMLLLQSILSGFLLAFSLVLLAVTLVVAGHSLSAALREDRRDIADLKTIGLTGRAIRLVYLALYGGVALTGILAGLLLSPLLAGAVARGMVSSTGLLITAKTPVVTVFLLLAAILLILAAFLLAGTKKILQIRPMQTISDKGAGNAIKSPLHKLSLPFHLALRTLISGKRQYAGLLVISLLLTLFLSIIGRMGKWLGPNGEGLMNAFSVAEHDLGVQPFNETVPMDEIERVINWYSPVRETYGLAMESVTVNGTAYTANVLDDAKWFHVLRGQVCGGDEILITDTVANEQGLSIGDTVRVVKGGRAAEYTVSGVYMCANGMGTNIGMSMAGYSKIGDITGFIWCNHYILENGGVRDYVMKYLQENYRGVDVHTNSWSGLDGIVSVMHLLIAVLYILAAVFILTAVALISSKLLASETADLAIYRSIGVQNGTLRLSFALRFLLVSAAGAALGMAVSALCSGKLIGAMFKLFGIGEFSASLGFLGAFLPAFSVIALFFAFSLLLSGRIGKVSIIRLVSENEEM